MGLRVKVNDSIFGLFLDANIFIERDNLDTK
jgi:hypothetical protein